MSVVLSWLAGVWWRASDFRGGTAGDGVPAVRSRLRRSTSSR